MEIVLIAIIVPAHNEEDLIIDCVAALQVAARCPSLYGEQILIIVVLDFCTDTTPALAQQLGVTTISLDARNVGAARALGAQLALAAGARWLAFTDADTQVRPDWIFAQLAQKSDAVCGAVAVKDWGSYGQVKRNHYDASYNDEDGYRHIHGANFGVSASAYEQAGGFQPLQSRKMWRWLKRCWQTGHRLPGQLLRAYLPAPVGFFVPLEDLAQRLNGYNCKQ